MAEEVVIVGGGAVNRIEVFDDVVGFVVRVGMLHDGCGRRSLVGDGRDGVVRVVGVERFGDGGCDVVVVHFVTVDGGEQTVGVVFEFREDFVHGGAGLADGGGIRAVCKNENAPPRPPSVGKERKMA